MADTIRLFMDLIRQRLYGDHASIDPTADSVQQLMALANKHDLTAVIGEALLEQDNFPTQELKLTVSEAVCKAVCYYEIMNSELNWLKDSLEEAQIPHMVLKGAAVREYYPQPWLRISGDMDILVPEDLLTKAEAVLLEKGCIPDGSRRYHDIPLKTPGNNLLELHYNIREDIPALDKTLDRVWDYCEKAPGKEYEYRQCKEFLLFHLLAHMSYHLTHGGCGIRSFVDIRLLQQSEHCDTDIFRHLCHEAQLTEFYENVQLLNDVWFGTGKHTPATQLLEQLVVSGGTFGTRNNQILIEQAYSGNKGKYLLGRIFMPYSLLKKQYPILEKYCFLVPVFQVMRWFRIIFCGRANHAFREMHTGHSHTTEQIQETKRMLQEIGLNFYQ